MKYLIVVLSLILSSLQGQSQCSVSAGPSLQFLCKGTSLTLQASQGFQQYVWSNGSTGANLQVSTSGSYTVKATTASNCVAYATVNVIVLNNAAFTVSGQPKCDTSSYVFINQSAVPVSAVQQFKWIFGDGSSYTSANPVTAADTAMWSNFTKKYTITGTFQPALLLWYPNQSCIDTFMLNAGMAGVTLPSNWVTFVDPVISSEPNSTSREQKICSGNKVYLKNSSPFPTNISGFSYIWFYSDPNAMPPGSDVYMQHPNPAYKYQKPGSFIPRIEIQCPNKPARIFSCYSRLDTINDNSGNAQASPVVYTVSGKTFAQNQWMHRSRYVYTGNKITDSLPSHWNLFGSLPADTNNKVKPENLFGYGIQVSGIVAAIENIAANVQIPVNIKNQMDGSIPIEFKNASINTMGTTVWNRWNFDDEFSPRCTSFSVPNPAASGNGAPPYTTAVDMNNRTFGKFIFKGQIYNGRVNCDNSQDTLPIHQYQTYNNLLRWFKNGYDFPPYDSSTTGWTKNPSQVSPGGKKLVHPLDTANWGKPKYSAGPLVFRIDTLQGFYPPDIQPNKSIILTENIPDPIASYKGFHGYIIPAGSSVDTGGFIIPPVSGILPDGTNRALYRGNTALPPGSGFKDLYEYFFNRNIPSAYRPRLQVLGTDACVNSKDSILVIGGKADPCGVAISRAYIPSLSGATTFDFSMTWPPAPLRTYILMNYDSLSDRTDATPCALDGFIDYQGISPITQTTTTPGGNTHPPFFANYAFSYNTLWYTPTGVYNRTHYINSGPGPYSSMPVAQNGKFSPGFIIGTGCSNSNCTMPAYISDTLWYTDAAQLKKVNSDFSVIKESGYAGYGNNGFLAGQDTTVGIRLNNNDMTTWCRLFGKGDVLALRFANPFPDNVRFLSVGWGDNTVEVDSFFYNQTDTLVVFSGNSYWVPKGKYAYSRMRLTYKIENNTLVLIKNEEFPLGQGRSFSRKYDTLYQCWDVMHLSQPLRIVSRTEVNDPSLNLNFLSHRYNNNSADIFPDHGLTNIDVYINSQSSDHTTFYAPIARGYLSSFSPEIVKAKYKVNEPIRFVDSIRYYNAATNGTPFGPNRPVFMGETEFESKPAFRQGMQNYPTDTLKVRLNPTRMYVTTGTGCPTGYVFSAGMPGTCTKLDTFFYERIYWDFESDGKIDYAGPAPVKSFNAAGTYLVSMITRDSVGYFDTVKQSITVVACSAFDPFPAKLTSCSDSALYLGLEPGYEQIQWYKQGSNMPMASNSIFFRATQDGMYKVESRDATGTCEYKDSVNLVFMNQVKIKQGPLQVKCSQGADTLRLEPTTLAGYQFQWDGNNNQPLLYITQSEGVKTHVLRIAKDGAFCFDSSVTAFVEPLKVSPVLSHACIRDSLQMNVLSNLAFGNKLLLAWNKDSNTIFETGGFSHLFVYNNTGIHKPMVKQSYAQCTDSFSFTLFADPTYMPPHITGNFTVKTGDTVQYTTPAVAGYTYTWEVQGGIVLTGTSTHQISVYWNSGPSQVWLKVTKSGPFCSQTDSVSILINATGINHLEGLQQAMVYPNPATHTLNIQATVQNMESYKYELLDMEGRVLQTAHISVKDHMLHESLDIANLRSGMYILRLTGDTGSRSFRWLKE